MTLRTSVRTLKGSTSLVAALFAAAICGCGAALAHSADDEPATEEDGLCHATHVVVGTVLTAARSDPPSLDAFCGHVPWNCLGYSSCQDDPHGISLRIKVSEVLGQQR